MEETKDVSMLKWWAQYTESTGDMDGALRIYQKAEDWFSQVKYFLHADIHNSNKYMIKISKTNDVVEF